MISGAKYRVTLTIENLDNQVSNTHNLPGEMAQAISERLHIEDEINRYTTDIMMDVDNLDELAEMLRDFGIPNADAFVLNTE
jgi:hypothetical protein